MENPACSVCRNISADFFVRKNNHNIFRCRNCGLLFVWPVPKNYLALYGESYFSGEKNELGYADYEGDREILAGTFKKYLEEMEAILPRRGKLLDVGAATGYFLELAKKNGWEAGGIEVSEYAAGIGRGKGLGISVGDFEIHDFLENNFDAVVFLDVLEHFGKPEQAFRQAWKTLKPGGILAINTPDSRSLTARALGKHWHAIVPPNHLNLFNYKNLRMVLEENGFEIVKVSRVGKKFSLQTVLKVLANWRKNSALRKISNYFLKSRVGRMNFYLNLRDNIFLVARKK